MGESQAISEIIDFYEGQGRFSARKDYRGMEASSVEELFDQYFTTLPEASKRQVAQVIVGGAVGVIKELGPYLANTMSLVLRLCIVGQAAYFLGAKAPLEEELNCPANLTAWAMMDDARRDNPFLAPDLAYKREWRYALSLLNVLRYLGSTRIADPYQYLLANARSSHFRQALMGYESGWLRSF